MFQATIKTSYSHGLENIYALENIDPRSIRPFQIEKQASKKPAKKNFRYKDTDSLDLGPEFRNWITPFFLEEPVDALELSKMEKKLLEDAGILYIKDLIHLNFDALISKGIGQGHWQEIRKKLKIYLNGKNIDKSYDLDFASFINVIFGQISRKKAYYFLSRYDLNSIITLISSDMTELKRLPLFKQQEWNQEIEIALEYAKCYVCNKIKEIAYSFIHPWMEKRLGFATLPEIIEYLENLSLDSTITEKALVFLSDTFFSGFFPFEKFLYPLEQGIYALNTSYGFDYQLIESKALSYFYKPSTSFPVNSLIHWLEIDFAQQWIGFHQGLIEKVLCLSPFFYLWHNAKGFTEIKLA